MSKCDRVNLTMNDFLSVNVTVCLLASNVYNIVLTCTPNVHTWCEGKDNYIVYNY